MAWHFDLSSLQDLDARKRRLNDRVQAINDELAASPELDEARASLDALQHAQATRQKEQRAAEATVADVQARIDQEEKRLYDGSIKAPKELASLQEEVDHLKASRAAREDSLMAILVETEDAAPALADQEALVARLATERTAREAELHAEAIAAAEEIASVESKAAALRETLSGSILRLYDDLARRKAGIGVANLKGSLCGACRVTAPDSVRRRTNDIAQVVQCPNCERILIPDP